MEQEFWQTRWRQNRIAFHEGQPNTLLSGHLERLHLRSGDAVFVPLCGKAVDLDWLVSQGHRVVGIEFNQQAVAEVFERNNLVPEVRRQTDHLHYHADGIDLFVGDFFHLTPAMVGAIDAVYDRAALVALPEPRRADYARHLSELSGGAPQLVISYDYEAAEQIGPPFSVPAREIETLYGQRYRLELVDSRRISGPLAERCSGWENAWLLAPR